MAGTRNTLTALFFALLLPFFIGCNARQVIRERDYGVVAIPANSNAWPFHYRDKATKIMSEHFPEGYEIVREEEVVVGKTTHIDEDVKKKNLEVVEDVFSVGTTQREVTTTTQDKTEWRISYQRTSRSGSGSEDGVAIGGGYSAPGPPGMDPQSAPRQASYESLPPVRR